ncbi:MAG: hypothetical protein ACFB10_25505 [Salibacteraceae bacterium]
MKKTVFERLYTYWEQTFSISGPSTFSPHQALALPTNSANDIGRIRNYWQAGGNGINDAFHQQSAEVSKEAFESALTKVASPNNATVKTYRAKARELAKVQHSVLERIQSEETLVPPDKD